MTEFPGRNWSLASVKTSCCTRLIDTTGSADRKSGSDRAHTARSGTNVQLVEELEVYFAETSHHCLKYMFACNSKFIYLIRWSFTHGIAKSLGAHFFWTQCINYLLTYQSMIICGWNQKRVTIWTEHISPTSCNNSKAATTSHSVSHAVVPDRHTIISSDPSIRSCHITGRWCSLTQARPCNATLKTIIRIGTIKLCSSRKYDRRTFKRWGNL